MGIPNEALIQKALSKVGPEDRLIFEQSYNRRAKSLGLAYVLWFFLGWHYAYMGRWGAQVLYWITLGGFLFWAVADLFRLPGMIANANKEAAIKTLHDLRLAADQPATVVYGLNPPSNQT